MTEPPFLTKEQVLYIHDAQLKAYGGRDGIRDENLLESALGVPRASFGGTFLHSIPYGMASAYAFHLAENQPFVDGNKRTALVAALVFLEAYGVQLSDAKGALYDAMKAVGSKQLTKTELEKLFKELAEML